MKKDCPIQMHRDVATCCDDKPRRCVSLSFRRKELIMDIRNTAYTIARAASVKGETPDRDDAWLIDIFQETPTATGNNELPTRWMNLAHREIDFALRRWSGHEVIAYGADDTFTMPDEYTFSLRVGDQPRVTFALLKELIHNWMVYEVLRHWCLLVAPEHLERIQSVAEELRNKIKDAVSDDGGVFIRPKYPFER